MAETDSEANTLLKKVVYLVFLGYFNDVIATFLALNMIVLLLSTECQKTLGFHLKYLHLCFEDERRSYGFGTTRGWVIHDRIFIFGWTIHLTLKACLLLFPFHEKKILIPISQGTEVTIVSEYVPFRYFTRTASRYRCKYGNQSNHAVLWRGTTRNQDSRGSRPRGVDRIHQAQGEPRGSSVAWVSFRRDTWCPYSYGQTKQRGAWTKLVKWTWKIAT